MMDTKEMDLFGSTTARSAIGTRNKRHVSELEYDAAFKKVFARKDVLAGILLNVVPEYRELTLEDVMYRLSTDVTNDKYANVTVTKDVSTGSAVDYDLVTTCYVNGENKDYHLIFDLEMQRKFNPGYKLIDRAVYYASRLITRQELSKSGMYKGIQPVNSTWISIYGVPEELQNTVHTTSLKCDTSDRFSTDLMSLNFILLSPTYDWDKDDNDVVKFLQSIFKNRLDDREFNKYIDDIDSIKKEADVFMTMEEEYRLDLESERTEGRTEGEDIAIQTFKLHQEGCDAHEISRKLNIDEERVTSILKKFGIIE